MSDSASIHIDLGKLPRVDRVGRTNGPRASAGIMTLRALEGISPSLDTKVKPMVGMLLLHCWLVMVLCVGL
jgi:hypothetical protein